MLVEWFERLRLSGQGPRKVNNLTPSCYTPIQQELLASAPTVPPRPGRTETIRKLDEQILVPGSDCSTDLTQHYQDMVDHALSTAAVPCEQGVRVIQLYASTVILQSGDLTVALDFVPGRPSPCQDQQQKSMTMRPDQVAAWVDLIDIAFHTHQHADHANQDVGQQLLEKGKTVIVTEMHRDAWAALQPWPKEPTVLSQTLDTPHHICGLTVDVLWDWQDKTACYAYIVKFPSDQSILVKGDINCALRLYGWLSALATRNRNVDAIVGSPLFWRGPALNREIDDLFQPLWLPGHTWEFTHRKQGESSGSCFTFSGAHQFCSGYAPDRFAVLTWGESIQLM